MSYVVREGDKKRENGATLATMSNKLRSSGKERVGIFGQKQKYIYVLRSIYF